MTRTSTASDMAKSSPDNPVQSLAQLRLHHVAPTMGADGREREELLLDQAQGRTAAGTLLATERHAVDTAVPQHTARVEVLCGDQISVNMNTRCQTKGSVSSSELA